MKKVYMLHARDPQKRRQTWVVFDGKNRVARRSQKKALESWVADFGQIEHLTRFKGVMRPSEAAMHEADIAMEVDAKEKPNQAT